MAITTEEQNKLAQFGGIKFTEVPTELILNRRLTYKEWKELNIDYKQVFSSIAKQGANFSPK